MDVEFVHCIRIIAYLALGTAGIALVMGWALKRFDLPGGDLERTVALAPDQIQFSEVMSYLQTVLSDSRPVLRLEHVLVPIDFTESSLRALPYAAFFARQFACRVTLVHVVHLNIVGEERGVPLTNILNEIKSAAERKLKSAALSFGIPTATIVVRMGVPTDQILAEIATSDVDLIILGRRRDTSVLKAVLPSIGRRIVSRASCPCFVTG